MPKSVCSDEAVQEFRKLVLDQYELEEEFIQKICTCFRMAVDKHVTVAAAPAAKAASKTVAAKDKPRRKKSAYNMYVKEMMKTPDIDVLDHKEKMSAIAKLWHGLDDDGKSKYQSLADAENQSSDASAPVADDE